MEATKSAAVFMPKDLVQGTSAPASIDDDDAGPISELIKRYQLDVRDLDFGMFVAELDRPWLDTPFLIQGFLVESQVELDTIRKHCGFVFVDFELSRPEVSEAILKADMANSVHFEAIVLGSTSNKTFNVETASDEELVKKSTSKKRVSERVYKVRSDLKVNSDTRQRFKQLIRGSASAFGVTSAPTKKSAFNRLMSWFKGEKLEDSAPTRGDRRRAAIKGLLDENIKLRNYRDKQKVEQELPRARQAFTKSEEALAGVAADIKIGRAPQMREVQGAVIDIVDSMIDNPDALIWVARIRDEDVRTYNHGVKVALYLVAFGRHLGFSKSDLANLGMIGMLADIGKTKLPRALIEKPGMLSAAEFDLIKEHVPLGLKALKKSMTLPVEVEEGIAQHHERLDGSGYPKRLKGDEIGIYGRMTAIADCFAALITPRAYANPAAPQEALMNLYQWAGTSFHEPLVEQFVQAVGVFPIGSLIELSSGEVAVVLSHNRVKRLEPRVLILTSTDKNPLAKPIELDLHRRVKDETVKPVRIVRGLPAGAYGLKLRDYYMTDVAKANGIS